MPTLPKSNQEQIRQHIIRDFFVNRKSLYEIAKQYNKRVWCAKRIIDTYKRRRSSKRKKGSGAPKKLTKDQKRLIRNSIQQNPFQSCQQLVKDLELDCSPETVRAYLKSLGLRYKEPDEVPGLTLDEKIERLGWAFWYRFHDFSNIIFSDECYIYLDSSGVKGWLPAGFCPQETIQFPPKLGVWVAIGRFGSIAIHVFEENTDSEFYINLIHAYLLPAIGLTYRRARLRWTLMHDQCILDPFPC